ncbi:twin-arginine translocase subunit TatC [Streptococcus sp. DD13]|uniref:twin-arginine translocase subunit TatC n=1 Tax=Streptococcus sp. DD13 TaxID=1777881 RepID=UPI00082B4432|nr:twin-arginine translocase subunit TatC [Streptococcus sp. DD13]
MKKDKELTIVEHLLEFRKRFMAVLLCFLLVFCGSFVFAGDLYSFLTAGFEQKLLVLGPNDILWVYVNLASIMAVSLTLPFSFFQIWQFVKPALRQGEVKAALLYIPASFICFVLGLLFGFYFVSPAILQVLLSLGDGLFETQLTAQNYLLFLLHTTLPMGILFELPVIVAFLTRIGLLNPSWLIHYRRYAYFVLLVLAVVLTPADFISDLAMTVPLILLYEVSIFLSRFVYKRKRRK